MKKLSAFLTVVLIAAVLSLAAPLAALAQETMTVSVFGIQIDVTAVDAVVALLGGGLVLIGRARGGAEGG